MSLSLEPGAHFGRYQLVTLLGSGGMGDVYRATDTILHRTVALKLLRYVADPDSVDSVKSRDGAARILREARLAAGLSHPNAISIFDVGEVDGVPFLAMEFVPGKTLRTYIGDPQIPLVRRVGWLADIARALGAAHDLGFVHRDIKPENVMVRDDGVVKVLDFGIARRLPPPIDRLASTRTFGGPKLVSEVALGNELEPLTAAGRVVGTPLYMAPEQMRGESLDGRADQFAWGVVAYELLTGTLPWDRDANPLKLVAQILSREVDPPITRNREIPMPLDAVVQTALAKSRSRRFARMDDLVAELEGLEVPDGLRPPRSHGARTSEAQSIQKNVAAEHSTRAQLVTAGRTLRSGRVGWRLSVLGLATLTVGTFIARMTHRDSGPQVSPISDARIATETESRLSTNPDATAAYKFALQAFHSASLDVAIQQLDRAVELDPSFAAAHLRRSTLSYDEIRPEIREHLQAARRARASLGQHDLVLLDAMEPWTLAPADLRESIRRFEAAVKKYPADPDFAFLRGWTLHHAYERTAAAAAFQDALEKDQTFAMAWCMKARELVGFDEIPKAMFAYNECLRLSPGATSCLDDVATIQGQEGQCAEMAATCRRLIGVAPDSPHGYMCLAEALLGQNEPPGAARTALQQKWDRSSEAARRRVQSRDEASLAAFVGAFDESLRANEENVRAVEPAPDCRAHIMPAIWKTLVSRETGRDADVGPAADDYLGRRSAWLVDDLSPDLSILLRDEELAAGHLTRARFGELRDQWVIDDRKRSERAGVIDTPYQGTRWALAYAVPALNARDAALALANLPDVHPLVDVLSEVALANEGIGRTYALAGMRDKAAYYSERAQNSCFVLTSLGPMFTTWAALDAGRAHEALGDRNAACASYRRVLERWGAAKPSSRTASVARERVASLTCPL